MIVSWLNNLKTNLEDEKTFTLGRKTKILFIDKVHKIIDKV